jgi:hypothetical protein
MQDPKPIEMDLLPAMLSDADIVDLSGVAEKDPPSGTGAVVGSEERYPRCAGARCPESNTGMCRLCVREGATGRRDGLERGQCSRFRPERG